MYKNIKYYIILSILFFSANINSAYTENYNLKDCLQESIDEKGNKHQSVSSEKIDYFLGKISMYAKYYPVKFDSDVQRKEVERELKSVIYMLETVLGNYLENQEILWRLGFAYSMAYNLDLPGSGAKCEDYFKRLLLLNPDHPQGNLLYGAYLGQTAIYQKESIVYLEKAASMGYDEAIYMLGSTYLLLKDNGKALKYYKRYLTKYPNSEETKAIIEAIKAGNVEVHKK